MNPERVEAAGKAAFDWDYSISAIAHGRPWDDADEREKNWYRSIATAAVIAADEAEASELVAVRSALRSLVDACELWAGDTSSDGQPYLPRRVAKAINEIRALDGLSETPRAEPGDYENYVEWCDEKGKAPMSRERFDSFAAAAETPETP